MCLIVDTNCLSAVFDKEAVNHNEFEPVIEWIYNGRGKIVYGGTKYLGELNKYLAIYLQLRKAGKAEYVDCNLVDAEEIVVSNMIQHNNFDDQHLVALLRVSGCKIICSLDQRAYTYFRHRLFFTPAAKRPKIYSYSGNADLLCPENIADICKPCDNTTNEQKKLLGLI